MEWMSACLSLWLPRYLSERSRGREWSELWHHLSHSSVWKEGRMQTFQSSLFQKQSREFKFRLFILPTSDMHCHSYLWTNPPGHAHVRCFADFITDATLYLTQGWESYQITNCQKSPTWILNSDSVQKGGCFHRNWVARMPVRNLCLLQAHTKRNRVQCLVRNLGSWMTIPS